MSKLYIDDKGVQVPVAELALISTKQQMVLGNLERDLILRTVGGVKIQVGNVFYDLPLSSTTIKGGTTIVTGSKVLILDTASGLNTLAYPGDGTLIYTRDTKGFYIATNGAYIQVNQVSEASSKIYLSFNESQQLTNSQKYTVGLNTGLIVQSINDVGRLNQETTYAGMSVYAIDEGKHYRLVDAPNPSLVQSWREMYLSTSGSNVYGDINIINASLDLDSIYNQPFLPFNTPDFDGLFIGPKDYTTGLGVWKDDNNVILSAQKNGNFGFKFITNGGLATYYNPLSLSNNSVGIGQPVNYNYTLAVGGPSLFNGKMYSASGLRSPNFVSGINGMGWDISVDGAGKYTLEVDKVITRGDVASVVERYTTLGIDGSLIMDYSIVLTNVDLIESIEVNISGSAAGRYSDTAGTVMPLANKSRYATVTHIPIANIYNDSPAKVTELVELAFGIGDKLANGSNVGYTTYGKNQSGTITTIAGTVNVDIINVYEVTTNVATSSLAVGDLLFFKEWTADKEQYNAIYAEVVAIQGSVILYVYGGAELQAGGELIRIANKYTQECFIQLNGSDVDSPYFEVASEISSFNDFIENWYYSPYENEPSNDMENNRLGKNQVRFKAGLLSNIEDASLGLTGIRQAGAYGDNVYFKGNFVSNMHRMGDRLTYANGVLTIPDYLPLAGGDMTGSIRFVNQYINQGVYWGAETDYGKIYFQTTGDAAGDSNLVFEVGDNNVETGRFEGFIFRKNGISDFGNPADVIDLLTVNLDDIKYKGVSLLTPQNTGEPVIAPGTTSQYWRGDKTWQNLNTAIQAFSDTRYSLNTHTHNYLPTTGGNMTGDITFADVDNKGIRWDRYTDYGIIYFESFNEEIPAPPGNGILYGRSNLVFVIGDDGYNQDAFSFRIDQKDVSPSLREQFRISSDYLQIDQLLDGVNDTSLLTIGTDRKVRQMTLTDLFQPEQDIRFINNYIGNGIHWGANTDYSKLYYESTGDGNNSSQMIFELGDNITGLGRREGWKFRKTGLGDPDAPTPSRDILVINDLEIVFTINGVEIGKIDESGFRLKAGKTFDSSGY